MAGDQDPANKPYGQPPPQAEAEAFAAFYDLDPADLPPRLGGNLTSFFKLKPDATADEVADTIGPLECHVDVDADGQPLGVMILDMAMPTTVSEDADEEERFEEGPAAEPTECPICGYKANGPWEEIEHMSSKHPEEVMRRRLAAGFRLRNGEWIDTLGSDS